MLPYNLASNAGELLQDDGGLSQEISSTILAQPESFANEIIHWEESWRFFNMVSFGTGSFGESGAAQFDDVITRKELKVVFFGR
jgi:hypothetical protein